MLVECVVSSMPRTHDGETGRFTTVYDDHEILNRLDTSTGVGTATVAEALGCTTTHAYRRLRTLEDEGDVTSLMIGGSRVWTLVGGEHNDEGDKTA